MKANLNRKELRKQKRIEVKEHRKLHNQKKNAVIVEAIDTKELNKKKLKEATNSAPIHNAGSSTKIGPLQTILLEKKQQKSNVLNKKILKDDLSITDPEDMEIQRLEKLLGIKGKESKRKAAAKLNKEYELFEGLDGDFGDFLFDLDDLTERVKQDDHSYFKTVKLSNKKLKIKHHEEESDDNNNDYKIPEKLKGEDIYGRKVDDIHSAVESGKYIPPAKRLALAKLDENSESVVTVRRQMNGLMNKLSDQSKDSIVRSIKTLFDKNSTSICNLVLKDCIMSACGNTTQLMSSLIPLFAAIISALHFSVSDDVGAYMIEYIAQAFHSSLFAMNFNANNESNSSLISSKLSSNCLLLLVYLYNFRVLHHTLIVDIMRELATGKLSSHGKDSHNDQNKNANETMEMEVELLECVIHHCGTSIRSDDPDSLKQIIQSLSEKCNGAAVSSSHSRNDDNISAQQSQRLRFMLESLLDLRNNKSRRIQSDNNEVVKSLRKWLGSIKTTFNKHNGSVNHPPLRVTLSDLLNADNKGRWWKAGAYWNGKDPMMSNSSISSNNKSDPAINKTNTSDNLNNNKNNSSSQKVDIVEQKLLRLASKYRMNTSVRRNIFVIVMSSRDVEDAYERLVRLELKGKEDREIVRVITECCGIEKTYNPFYAELMKMLCEYNRQSKTTLQYTLWDLFKVIGEEDSEDEAISSQVTRKSINIGRYLSHLVCSFHLPLSVIKPIDMTSLNDYLLIMLSTFFLALFTEKISDDSYQSMLDRVATTKDFAVVRDNILLFLQ
eukprot:gene11747-15719_t